MKTSLLICVLVGLLGCDDTPAPAPAQDVAPAKPAAPQKVEPKPKSAAPTLPAVDPDLVAQAIGGLDRMQGIKRAEFAARATAKVESNRIGSLKAGFEALASAAPEARGSIIAKTITENTPMLEAACDGNGVSTLRSVATEAPDQRADLVWSGCKFARLGLITDAEAKASDPVAGILAHMAFVHLRDQGAISAGEKKLLHAVAQFPPQQQ